MEDALPKHLNQQRTVTLRHTTGDRYCRHIRDDSLPENALVVEIDDPCVTSVHIGVQDITAVATLLSEQIEKQQVLETVKLEQREISPTERQCSICKESFHEEDAPYHLHQAGIASENGGGPIRTDTYIHSGDCAKELQDVLERAWDSSDILLPKML